MSPADRARQQAALLRAFATLPGYMEAKTVLLYVSAFPEEFETLPMLRAALEQGKRLVCPRVKRDETRLELFAIEDPTADFEPGTLGILEPRLSNRRVEPELIDWVLVPGVAYDDRGHRIGRGAGHYDRLLPRLRPDTPRWSLAFDEQWVEAVPVQSHDQPLDGIVSPGRRFPE
ncbi:MAG: 5,10-methenyltetrahydrofolate synthetase [Planctomycetota bacterium]|nr:5,10-methenyltetrahydrofolate synthetase [Planctomycetota bacterium]